MILIYPSIIFSTDSTLICSNYNEFKLLLVSSSPLILSKHDPYKHKWVHTVTINLKTFLFITTSFDSSVDLFEPFIHYFGHEICIAIFKLNLFKIVPLFLMNLSKDFKTDASLIFVISKLKFLLLKRSGRRIKVFLKSMFELISKCRLSENAMMTYILKFQWS